MKVFNYDVDGPVDLDRFDADWKFQRSIFQRSLSDFPPLKFSWQGGIRFRLRRVRQPAGSRNAKPAEFLSGSAGAKTEVNDGCSGPARTRLVAPKGRAR
jgi:hypothetical protein